MTDEQRRLALLRAADLIEEFGWAQGPLGMPQEERGPLCVLGACAQAAYDLRLARTDGTRGSDLGESILGWDATAAFCWNDDGRRHAHEVTALLRATAASLSPVETLAAA